LAYIIFCGRQEPEGRRFTLSPPKNLMKILVLIGFFVALIFLYHNFKAYSENKKQQKAYRNIVYQNYTAAENIMKVNWGSWGPYERDILRNYVEYIEGLGLSNLPLELRSNYIKIVKDIALETEKNIDKYNKKSPTEYESMLRSYVMLWGAGDKNENKINETYQKLLAMIRIKQLILLISIIWLSASNGIGPWHYLIKSLVMSQKFIIPIGINQKFIFFYKITKSPMLIIY